MAARTLRFVCEAVLLGTVVLLGSRGLVLSWHRVEGPSMLPHYWGGGYQRRCPECGYRVRVALPPGEKRPTWCQCPQCGAAPLSLKQARYVPGQVLLLPRLTGGQGALQLWQPVLLRHPRQPTRVLLKRIAGLPGQQVAIRKGELHIDGRVAVKPPRLWHKLLVPVHDSRHQLSAPWASGWKTTSAAWQLSNRGFRFDVPDSGLAASAEQNKSVQTAHWIHYRRGNELLRGDSGGQTLPLDDTLGENQALPRRQETIHRVDELLLECKLTWHRPGVLLLELAGPRGVFRLQVDAAVGQALLRVGGQVVEQIPLGPSSQQVQPLGLALLDGHVWFRAGGPWKKFPLPQAGPNLIASVPVRVRIGALSGRGELSRVRLWRDVYYLGPRGTPSYEFGRVPSGHVLVLGDNSFQSDDSRTWPSPWVPVELVLGKPLRLGW